MSGKTLPHLVLAALLAPLSLPARGQPASPPVAPPASTPAAQETPPPASAPAGSPSAAPVPQTTPAPPAAAEDPPRRAQPAPFDSVFPGTDFLGPTVGVPDTAPIYPLTQALWDLSPELKKANIKVYGWMDASFNASTSKYSNTPAAYPIVPNSLQLDQFVLRVERVPDTVQTDHVDWGFRISQLYGIDYRYTTAQGIFSDQLLKQNNLYGYDPVEAYALLYLPHVADGMLVRAGRWISPVDIEAQFSPDNYMFTHSLTYTADPYTQTGVEATIKIDNQFSLEFGVHAGCDFALWDKGAQPTAQLLLRWVSPDNNDSVFGGINSLNNGQFRNNHDNLNQIVEVWTHRFSSNVHVLTEAYYMWQYNALSGGTVNDGPVRSYGGGGGAGPLIPGLSNEYGIINNLEIKLGDNDFLSVRNEYFNDLKGQRFGYVTPYTAHGLGWTHNFSPLATLRPEILYERALNATPFDNGTRKAQFMFSLDGIIRF